jgi:hypothetical protein
MQNKRCPKCGEEKPLTKEFWSWITNKKTGWNGPRYICKQCRVIQQTQYEKKHPDIIKQFRDKPEQKEKQKIRHRKYYVEHKDLMNEKSSQWALNNPEKRKMIWTKYYQNNKQKAIDSAALSAKLNHGRTKEVRKKYYAKLMSTPGFREKRNEQAKKRILNLTNTIIANYLCAHDNGFMRDNITPEMIELKRQQILMKRTLKQFKAWRKEYESNNPDVQREQRENEETNGGQGHTQP